MVAMMMLAALMAQDTRQNVSTMHHVRAGDPKIVALFNAGMSRSLTFRQLVELLDRSDVIVYVEPQLTRQALGGYLAHNIGIGGAYRYLHVAVDVHGTERRLVPLLAHELQHAVEVAADTRARDARSVELLFERLAVQFGCGGTSCSETQAAKDVEARVAVELAAAH
jgi:hypothetical protein